MIGIDCPSNGSSPTGTLTSTFGQVHLPPHTIDSVRSIVSLPLLHPHAFQYGILKEHGITGCLLFGPPGTGKTLVVRALAKEAECRMLAVSPSDVMDMASFTIRSVARGSNWLISFSTSAKGKSWSKLCSPSPEDSPRAWYSSTRSTPCLGPVCRLGRPEVLSPTEGLSLNSCPRWTASVLVPKTRR